MISRLRNYIDKDYFIKNLSHDISKHEKIIFDMFVSNVCNLKCNHCYFLNYKPSSEPLDWGKWINIIDDCISIGIRHFHFSGKEPFCDQRIPFLLKRLNELSRTQSIKYGLVTNGTMLTTSYLNELVTSNLSYLEFSLEGNDVFNQTIRGTNSFDTIYNLVKGIPNKSKFNITSTFFGNNLHNLQKMIDVFSETGISKFNIAPYLQFENSRLQPIKELKSKSIKNLINHFRNYLESQKGLALDIRICMTRMQAYNLFIHSNSMSKEINDFVYNGKRIIYKIGHNIIEVNFPLLFIPFFSQIVVTTDGKIISCADDIHYKNINEISLGDLKKDNMETLMKLRKNFIHNYINLNLLDNDYS